MAHAAAVTCLEKVSECAVFICRWLRNGCPHLVQIVFPGLYEPLQGRLGLVSENKQEDSALMVRTGCKQLQVDLRNTSTDENSTGSLELGQQVAAGAAERARARTRLMDCTQGSSTSMTEARSQKPC